jgi:hypothetical protein
VIPPGTRRAIAEHVMAALPGWVAARLVVVGALALARFFFDELAPGRPRPGTVDDGLLGWDAGWYSGIATHGYEDLPDESVRFFPLVPLLTRALAVVLAGNEDLALVVLANGAALAAGVLLFRLARHETGDRALAVRAAWFLAIAPPAFVLVMGYAESVLMALAVATFLGLRKRRWLGAAAGGALAALTRPIGLLLVVPAAVEAVRGWRRAAPPERAMRALAVLAPLAGTAAYLGWVAAAYGDAWLPIRVQHEAGRRGAFVNPVSALADAGRHLLDGDRIGTGLHVPWAVVLVVLVVVAFRRWPASYGGFAAAVVLVALSARNLDSLERYGLSAFPLVLAAASLADDDRVERIGVALGAAGMAGYALLAFAGAYVP